MPWPILCGTYIVKAKQLKIDDLDARAKDERRNEIALSQAPPSRKHHIKLYLMDTFRMSIPHHATPHDPHKTTPRI